MNPYIVSITILVTLLTMLNVVSQIVVPQKDIELKLAAFNVQTFGKTKMSKPSVVEILVKIFRRYDATFMQEIRDISGEAIQELLEKINEGLVLENQYKLLLSPRLGRSTSKEQYAWIYKSSNMGVRKYYVYNDTLDIFERPPFVVWWELKYRNTLQVPINILTIGMHAKPDDVVNELNALHDVYHSARNIDPKFSPDLAIVLGDFNADCTYVRQNSWTCIRSPTCEDLVMRLWNKSSWIWLINDAADTTVKQTDCAYDRVVIRNYTSLGTLPKASVFYFGDLYELNSEEEEKVSDHYPIEIFIPLASVFPEYYVDSHAEKLSFINRGIVAACLTSVLIYNLYV